MPQLFNNTTEPGCPARTENSDGEKAIKTLAYTLVIIIALFGNLLVIKVVYITKKMRTITNFQIVNMSVADLLITVTAMPSAVYQIYCGYRWPFGLIPCKLVVFLQGISVSCSVFTMACIAIDRYFAILFPYKRYIDQRHCNVMIVLCWLFAILLQCPTLYAMKVSTHRNVTVCVEDWEPLFDKESSPKIYTVVLFVAMYMFPLILIAILYTAISWFLWTRKTLGVGLTRSRKDRSKTHKVIKMLVIIVVTFAVCWLPNFISQFMIFFAQPKCGVSPHLVFVGLLMSHGNSACNPAIYWMFNDNFRNGFKKVLRAWFCPCLCASGFVDVSRSDSVEMQPRTTKDPVVSYSHSKSQGR